MWKTAINSILVKHVVDGTNAMRENVTKNMRKTYIKKIVAVQPDARLG